MRVERWHWSFAQHRAGLEDAGHRDAECRGNSVDLDPVLADWDRLEELPGARVLKHNMLRTVIALPATTRYPALVIKRYQIRGMGERLKYLLAPSRALCEWRGLRHFERTALPGPRPLAVGEAHQHGVLVAAGLIMECIEHALPSPTWLESNPVASRLEALTAIGREVARMHDSGIDHTDLHAGNILVDVDDSERVYLLDLHAAHIGAQVPRRRRFENLAHLFHSLRSCLSAAERMALFESYSRHTRFDATPAIGVLIRRLERRALRLERIRLRSRSRRCWKNSSDFARARVDRWQTHRRRELELGDLCPFFEAGLDYDQIFKERREQRIGTVVLVTGDGVRKVVVKSREFPGIGQRLTKAIAGNPLARAWAAARALEVRDIATPRALAFAVERRWGLPVRTLLITEYVTGSRSLHADLRAPASSGDAAEQRRVPAMAAPEIRQLAAFVRHLHDTGIYHSDLNPANVLVVRPRHHVEFLLVDLDSVKPARALTDRRRLKNLTQLGLLPEGHVSVRDRLRFLCSYDECERRWWSRDIVARLARELAIETVAILARMSRKEARS